MLEDFPLAEETMEFLNGCLGGIIGMTISYPFDTIKTTIQTGGKRFPRTIRGYYPGFTSPLIGTIIEKSVLFGSYDKFKNIGLDGFSGGIASGVLTTLVATPFERIKIKAQVMKVSSPNAIKYIIKNNGIASIYRGWSSTLFREVPGFGIYMYVLKKTNRGGDSGLGYAFFRGICAGTLSWAVIYPSDPVKTVMQNENIGLKLAIQKIYSQGGPGGFYQGFWWAIGRAALLHGGVIMGYSLLHKHSS